METQQMMELLLARMNSSMKEYMQEMMARMEANRESNKEDMLAEIKARIDANTKEMNATQERINTILKNLKEDIKPSEAEMRSTVCTFWFE
jgi:gas vesicle protein